MGASARLTRTESAFGKEYDQPRRHAVLRRGHPRSSRTRWAWCASPSTRPPLGPLRLARLFSSSTWRRRRLQLAPFNARAAFSATTSANFEGLPSPSASRDRGGVRLEIPISATGTSQVYPELIAAFAITASASALMVTPLQLSRASNRFRSATGASLPSTCCWCRSHSSPDRRRSAHHVAVDVR